MSDHDPLGLGIRREQTALAAATYRALRETRKLSSHRLLTYRCPRRCLLLDVVQLPQGLIWHSPRYKLSTAVNQATSSAGGRAKNTLDGDHRWRERTVFETESMNAALTCDHVLQVVLDKADVHADLAAGHTEVQVDSTGKRCPL